MIDRALTVCAAVCLVVILLMLAVLFAGIAFAQAPRGTVPPRAPDGEDIASMLFEPYEPKVSRICKFRSSTVTKGRLYLRLPDGAHTFYVYATLSGHWEVIAVYEATGESCLFSSGRDFDLRFPAVVRGGPV